MSINNIQCFERSGLAKVSDLSNEHYQYLFEFLEKEQKDYFKLSNPLINNAYFRKWPKDTLHWWSRIWEYPYVYYNIEKIIKDNTNNKLKILDFGSGVNFFPFSISNLGCDLTCVDYDEFCIDSLTKILEVYPKYSIVPVRNKGINIPFDENTFDVVYSVSVFEHIDELTDLVKEISRIVKNNGYLIITFDLSLNKNFDLQQEKYENFINTILEYFDLEFKYFPVHPADILTSDNSPIPYNKKNFIQKTKNYLINYLLKPIMFKKPINMPPALLLSVEGMVLRKREIRN